MPGEGGEVAILPPRDLSYLTLIRKIKGAKTLLETYQNIKRVFALLKLDTISHQIREDVNKNLTLSETSLFSLDN